MDAITILGTAGAVVNIVDIINRSIKTLRDLHERWQDADFIAMNLITQLVALKAALSKISEWASLDLGYHPHHYQLVMDFRESIGCCKMLVKSMDDQLAKLQCGTNNKLDTESRLRIVFENRVCENFQMYIQRQTNALTLLLTACNCESMFEQKLLLENPMSRDVFNKAKDDSSSLVALRDRASDHTQVTRSTGNSSKMSQVFQFDAELFSSGVYQRAVRSMVRDARHTSTVERKVLLLGARGSGKEDLMKQMKVSHRNINRATEILCYKYIILSATIDLLRNFLGLLANTGPEDLVQACNIHRDTIFKPDLPIESTTTELAAAMELIWEAVVPHLTRLRRTQEINALDETALYFLEQIPRIIDRRYVPTEYDILRLPAKYEYTWNKALQETRLSFGRLSMHIIGCSGDSHSQRSDWIPQFRDVKGVAFLVDLCSYSQPLPPSTHNSRLLKCLYTFNIVGTGRSIYTKLMEILYLFEAVANSRSYRESSMFLFFTGLEALKKRLAEESLSDHFPDYRGGEDVDRAVDYILGLFTKVNRAQLHLHSSILPLGHEEHFQLDPVLETLSDSLTPTTEKRRLAGERSASMRTAPSQPLSGAKICSMALSDSTMYAAHSTALRALC